MGSIAIILYLPQHILFIINRAWFYVNGGESSGVFASSTVSTAKDALSLSLSSAATGAAATSDTLREL
jgi:hypothetical protein